MQEFQDKVAVVTGAASGIGRGLAERFATEGMKVVLADVEEDALARAAADLRAQGARVLAVRTDVRQASEVEVLAEKTLAAFGGVHVVCNNAGVAVIKSSWEHTLVDWEWVLGVNLWGVIHGVRTFVPIMLDQGTEGHIVNTASEVGLSAGGFMGSYIVSKYGVVALSEGLADELAQLGAPIKVTVLCPGFVRTSIMSSARNRPSSLANSEGSETVRAEAQRLDEVLRSGVENKGTPPAEIANQVIAAIRAEKLYVVPQPPWDKSIRARLEGILEELNATAPPS
jgi:NAD(P)-dependent dehydrogenase (short-subunit alcohol dehydrogenase family)